MFDDEKPNLFFLQNPSDGFGQGFGKQNGFDNICMQGADDTFRLQTGGADGDHLGTAAQLLHIGPTM